MIVADADLVSYMALPGIRSAAAMSAYTRDSVWIAPTNLRAELLNVISKNVRAGNIDLHTGIAAYKEALAIVDFANTQPSDSELLELSVGLKTSTYDSANVWLARSQDVRLVTGDMGLVRCAPDVAVSIEDFASGK